MMPHEFGAVRTFITLVSRNMIRLLSTLLAVALVTLVLAWYAHTHRLDDRCGRMADGDIIFCE
jgi:hypothetical protein